MAIQKRTSAVSLASATSANGTARNGTALAMELVHPGTILAECVGSITTASVVATYKLQVSMDNSTWIDLKLTNNAANVTIAGGGGSALDHAVALYVPKAVAAYKFLRCVATLSGAATAGADVTAVTFRYIQMGGIPN
jgi:hypothetical protein